MDLSRQIGVFDPFKIPNRPGQVAVIGAGATGSAMCLELAKAGLGGFIHVWDGDLVEEHNLSNQLYGRQHVGEPKVTALQRVLESMARPARAADSSRPTVAINQRMVEATAGPLRAHTFIMALDHMEADQRGAGRRELFEKCVFLNGVTNLVVDMRIGSRVTWIYAFDPTNPKHIAEYRESLHSDAVVAPDTGNCQITQTIGATARLAASLAMWAIIDHANGQLEANEVCVQLQTRSMMSRSF